MSKAMRRFPWEQARAATTGLRQRSGIAWLLLTMLVLVPLVGLASLAPGQEAVARGKMTAPPPPDKWTPELLEAQGAALADARVQDELEGHRAEVFGVRPVGHQFTEASRACATVACHQVEIYLWDENATVLAIVNQETGAVLDVLHQPNVRPGIPSRLAERARAIAFNDPEVIRILGYRPSSSDWSVMDSGLGGGSACDGGHLCVVVLFQVHSQILWVNVDLTDQRMAGTFWTTVAEGEEAQYEEFVFGGNCPAPGTVEQDGWSIGYETTPTDGFRVYDVSYQGRSVLTSAKITHWNVEYTDYYADVLQDSTGCGGGSSGGYQIYPYGLTRTEAIVDPESGVAGFELVQDFRMGNWGYTCNYRYEQHMQFFEDGRFRVVGAAFGQGCDPSGTYRAVMRLDVAVNDTNNTLDYWDGSDWTLLRNERIFTNTMGTAEGYGWRVTDDNGDGYFIEPGRGQFEDGGRGDNPILYVTRHNPAEGDTDFGIFGGLNHNPRGPEQFINDEPVNDENLVLWYLPQMRVIVNNLTREYYCWTLRGEPTPETYPCFGGPMFVPIEGDGGEVTPTATSTPTSTPIISSTPTVTPSPSVTGTPPTATPTSTPTSTATPTVTGTRTVTPTSTPTVTGTPPTVTATVPATATATATRPPAPPFPPDPPYLLFPMLWKDATASGYP